MNKIKYLIILFVFFNAHICESQQPKVTGIFESGWRSCDRNLEQWDGHMKNLSNAGIDTVILERGISMGPKGAKYYPSNYPWAPASSICASVTGRLLSAAKSNDINVYIGLYYDESVWWKPTKTDDLRILKERSIEVLNEIEALYGDNASLKGYYLPQEIARYYWSKSEDSQRLLSEFLMPVTQKIQATNKKVLASPYFNSCLETSAQDKTFFDHLFSSWKPDFVAPQDGIGVGHATLDNVKAYIGAISAAARENGVVPWGNVELFALETSDCKDIAAPTIDRVKKQINAAGGLVDKIVSYEYHNFAPNNDPSITTDLYKKYISEYAQ